MLIWSCLLGISNAGTIKPSNSDKQHIEYGSQFTHVVRLTVISKDNKKMMGSAVIINKHWILTAAHVIQDAKSCVVSFKDQEYCLSCVVQPKDFTEDNVGKYDIAAGYSEEPFDISFDMELYTEDNEVNKICSIAGFGITGNFSTGATISDSLKRAGSNRIKDIYSDLLICSVTDPKPTSMEFLIASGDSGGGLFIDGKLAGINSCVLSEDKNGPNSDYGDESGHTRISKYVDWITEVINQKEVQSNLEPSE